MKKNNLELIKVEVGFDNLDVFNPYVTFKMTDGCSNVLKPNKRKVRKLIEKFACDFLSLCNGKEDKEIMKKYKIFVRRYSIMANDYILEEKEVLTDDIYHEIGYIYCNSLEEIKRIDYMEVK